MSMKIITGHKGEPHINPQMDRDVNKGIFGSGIYIADVGEKLAATIVSANEIQIADGVLIAEGCAAEIPYGTTESLAIANGAQGMLRKDLIVARYNRVASTNVESMSLAVITGTPAASNPAQPAYTSGSLVDGDTQVDFPLYEVDLDGLTITEVVCLVGESKSTEDMSGILADIMTALTGKANTYKWTTDSELISAIPGMASREVFLYAGNGRFSQDVLMTGAPHDCFGIGYKASATTVFLLSVCYGKLYYSIQRTDLSGESYWPVNLKTNV